LARKLGSIAPFGDGTLLISPIDFQNWPAFVKIL
jgi:hypothetical protein